jgi:hypothetical protein
VSDIFTTNLDQGSPNGYLPALLQLQKSGYTIIAAASPQAAAGAVFRQAGLTVHPLRDQSHWATQDALTEMETLLRQEGPKCVVVGISGSPTGSEKTAIVAAKRLGIPVVALIEGWPHRWLLVHGDRDTPIYKQVDRICIPDNIAKTRLLEEGFHQGQIAVTGNPLKDTLLAQKADATEYRSKYRAHFGIPDDAIVLLYGTTASLDNPDEDHPGSPEWLGYSEREAVIEFLLGISEAGANVNPSKPIVGVIRVKPSPSYPGIVVRELIAKYCPSVHYDQVNYSGKAVPLFGSDAVIGMSTLLVEQAGDLGMPTICYLPNVPPEKDMLVNTLKIVFPLYKEKGLGNMIRYIANDPEKALKNIQSRQVTGTPISDAASNVAAEIASFCRK